MSYDIHGTLLEVCTCDIRCACCWADSEPTGDDCDRVLAWSIESGSANGVDLGGITVAMLGRVDETGAPVKSFLYVPESVTNAQFGALVALWSGAYGGPMRDLAAMLGEFVGAQRAPIEVRDGGHLVIGSAVLATVGAGNGDETTLAPGVHGSLGTAGEVRGANADLGISFEVTGQRAVTGEFRFAG